MNEEKEILKAIELKNFKNKILSIITTDSIFIGSAIVSVISHSWIILSLIVGFGIYLNIDVPKKMKKEHELSYKGITKREGKAILKKYKTSDFISLVEKLEENANLNMKNREVPELELLEDTFSANKQAHKNLMDIMFATACKDTKWNMKKQALAIAISATIISFYLSTGVISIILIWIGQSIINHQIDTEMKKILNKKVNDERLLELEKEFSNFQHLIDFTDYYQVSLLLNKKLDFILNFLIHKAKKKENADLKVANEEKKHTINLAEFKKHDKPKVYTLKK
ncbi:MAG: hypothetical protein PHD02_00790 [Bacilli bacterium]|nr:hypothetical protein [Bacilli bacterium]